MISDSVFQEAVESTLDEKRKSLRDSMRRAEVPEHCQQGVEDYLLEGHRQGDFLMAVMCNDLMEAAVRADMHNRHALHAYAIVLHNDFPSIPMKAYGSDEIVEAWIKSRGLRGFYESQKDMYDDAGRDNDLEAEGDDEPIRDDG